MSLNDFLINLLITYIKLSFEIKGYIYSFILSIRWAKDDIHSLPPSFHILANQKGKNRVLEDFERCIPSEEKYLEAFHSIYQGLTSFN